MYGSIRYGASSAVYGGALTIIRRGTLKAVSQTRFHFANSQTALKKALSQVTFHFAKKS